MFFRNRGGFEWLFFFGVIWKLSVPSGDVQRLLFFPNVTQEQTKQQLEHRQQVNQTLEQNIQLLHTKINMMASVIREQKEDADVLLLREVAAKTEKLLIKKHPWTTPLAAASWHKLTSPTSWSSSTTFPRPPNSTL